MGQRIVQKRGSFEYLVILGTAHVETPVCGWLYAGVLHCRMIPELNNFGKYLDCYQMRWNGIGDRSACMSFSHPYAHSFS
jgi:hypothetical protein